MSGYLEKRMDELPAGQLQQWHTLVDDFTASTMDALQYVDQMSMEDFAEVVIPLNDDFEYIDVVRTNEELFSCLKKRKRSLKTPFKWDKRVKPHTPPPAQGSIISGGRSDVGAAYHGHAALVARSR